MIMGEGMELPDWCRLIRADNPGPMTLDGTNTYVITSEAGNVVVDPGPLIEGHLRRIADLGRPVLTLLTHHHLDHTESAVRFHEMTGAPVAASDPALCIAADPLLDDSTIDVPGIGLRVLHTPGHTADSVCVEVVRDQGGSPWQGLLTGDTVLGRGTTIVAHPDGRLADYLNSLERLRSRLDPSWVLLPAHGPVRPDAARVIGEYIEHRRARLAEVRAALTAGATSAREVVEIVYADVERALWPAAEHTVAAALDYIAEVDGRSADTGT